jgi:hypothetical protein
LSPSHEALSAQLSALIEFARTDAGGGDVAAIVWDLAATAEKDYEETRAERRDDAFFGYLPVPDDNKYQKPVWVLPNLSAFTNIYTRINLYEEVRPTPNGILPSAMTRLMESNRDSNLCYN